MLRRFYGRHRQTVYSSKKSRRKKQPSNIATTNSLETSSKKLPVIFTKIISSEYLIGIMCTSQCHKYQKLHISKISETSRPHNLCQSYNSNSNVNALICKLNIKFFDVISFDILFKNISRLENENIKEYLID